MSLLGGLRDKLAGFLRPFSTNKHLRYGLPFISLLVGSTFAIKEIRQGWYDYGVNRAKPLGAEELAELEKRGILLKRKTLEEVFEETPQPEDDYEIVRGPRPWEDHPQKEQAQANKKLNGVKITPSYGL